MTDDSIPLSRLGIPARQLGATPTSAELQAIAGNAAPVVDLDSEQPPEPPNLPRAILAHHLEVELPDGSTAIFGDIPMSRKSSNLVRLIKELSELPEEEQRSLQQKFVLQVMADGYDFLIESLCAAGNTPQEAEQILLRVPGRVSAYHQLIMALMSA